MFTKSSPVIARSLGFSLPAPSFLLIFNSLKVWPFRRTGCWAGRQLPGRPDGPGQYGQRGYPAIALKLSGRKGDGEKA